MEKSVLIRKINMACPICDQTHEVEERKRMSETIIKDEKVIYEEKYYLCSHAKDENEFENGALLNENLLNARNAYRKKMGLLTSDEIIAIREGYGLSQVDMARLLGWGEATVSRYESKAIQDKAYDTMLHLIKDNPSEALALLKKNGNQIPELKKKEIHSKIADKINAYGKEYMTRQMFEGEYVSFDEPSDFNGNTILNIDKIEAIISYFAAAKVLNLFKTKLMKMIWYSDALSYKETGKAITGMVYRHEKMGALPIGHYSLMNLENLTIREETSYHYDSMFHIYPNEKADYSVLTEKEIKILDKVIKKFQNYEAKEIIDYMHKEEAYKKTSSGEIIPFSLAKEIKEF